MKTRLNEEIDEQELIKCYTKPSFILNFRRYWVEKSDIKAESMRTVCIKAKIIKIITESDAENDYLKLVCEYEDENYKKRYLEVLK